MDETGMKPRFHHYNIGVLLFTRCETGETELSPFSSETEVTMQFQLQTPDMPQVAVNETGDTD